MNAAIVDTDVVSMLFKGDTRAIAYRPHIEGRLLGISFMTLAELDRWSLERNCGRVRKALSWRSICKQTPSYPRAAICAPNGPRWLSRPRERDIRFKRPTRGSRPARCTIMSRSSPTIETITDS